MQFCMQETQQAKRDIQRVLQDEQNNLREAATLLEEYDMALRELQNELGKIQADFAYANLRDKYLCLQKLEAFVAEDNRFLKVLDKFQEEFSELQITQVSLHLINITPTIMRFTSICLTIFQDGLNEWSSSYCNQASGFLDDQETFQHLILHFEMSLSQLKFEIETTSAVVACLCHFCTCLHLLPSVHASVFCFNLI